MRDFLSRNIIIVGLMLTITFFVMWGWYEVQNEINTDHHNIKLICLEGFYYYKSNDVAQFGLAVKLDKDGKPIPCVKID